MDLFGHKSLDKYGLVPLTKERDELIDKYNAQVLLTQKANEQVNLLRFKIEILLNMMGMEEKKYEATVKRFEALKWASASDHVDKYVNVANEEAKESNLSPRNIDISGALSRMRLEFNSNRQIIILKFADEEDQLIPFLSREDFVNSVLSVTSSSLTIVDVEALALRFYDDDNNLVSVSEFLDYFVTSSVARQARYATSAVRNSLQLLALQEEPDSSIAEEEVPVLLRKSLQFDKKTVSASVIDATLPTDKLELALLKLVTMWHLVETLLLQLMDSSISSNTVDVAELKESLETACGELSQPITKYNRHEKDRYDREIATASSTSTATSNSDKDGEQSAIPQPKLIEYLTMSDINLIVDRFELGGLVDRQQFISYFSNISNKLKLLKQYQHHTHSVDSKAAESVSRTIVTACASPFRASSEWSQLKAKTLEAPVDASIPHRRKFENTLYASEFAEAKHKKLPLPEEPMKLELIVHTSPVVIPKPMTNDEFDNCMTSDTDDEDLASKELKRKKEEENEARRRKIAEADAKAAQKSTKLHIDQDNYNRVLDAYSKDPKNFEDDLGRCAVDHAKSSKKGSGFHSQIVTNASLMSYLLSEYPYMNDNSSATVQDENKDIEVILDCLEIPTDGLRLEALIVEFRKLLDRYKANKPLKLQKPTPKVVIPPKPILKAPFPAPKPVQAPTPVATPNPAPNPAPVATPSPAPTTPIPVTLTQEEQSEIDEIDRQIQAKRDMLSSTSPIVMYYKEHTKNYNTLLSARSVQLHPDPQDKVPYLTKDEISEFFKEHHSNITPIELKAFITTELGGIVSDNGTIAIKDLKKYFDNASAQVSEYHVDIEKLEKKKRKAAERRANGGKPISMFARMLGMFSGDKSSSSSTSSTSSTPVPPTVSIPPSGDANTSTHSLNTSPTVNDRKTSTGDGSDLDTPSSGKEPFAMLDGK